ncbi:MAG: sigma-54 dependent transcriptional regulator, partial [Acidobacteriota bacterium]|nr:sigma-54 dependent transcriptional regulator [Acidobacteriota bacterium]
ASAREFVTGKSRAMQDVMEVVQKIARLSATVLVLGESGTGKELLARTIHRESSRDEAGAIADRPFIAVNLAAIPRDLVESTLFGHERGAFTGALQQRIGKFELASGGTLFLDEIGDLRLELQAKLLRAIQEGEVERVGGSKPIRTTFRLIAATNVDLERAVKEGSFRGDLFYRLNVIPVRLPPLRERLDDLPALADFFLRRYNARFQKHIIGIADSTLRMLGQYWWPGNIRELENAMERAVALEQTPTVLVDSLPDQVRTGTHVAAAVAAAVPGSFPAAGFHLEEHVQHLEREYIAEALRRAGGVKVKAAELLGMSFRSFRYYTKKYNLK